MIARALASLLCVAALCVGAVFLVLSLLFAPSSVRRFEAWVDEAELQMYGGLSAD